MHAVRERETLSDAMAPLGWWPAIATGVLGAAVGIVWLVTPVPPPLDIRGAWVAGRDTLVFASPTGGTFRREPFRAMRRDNRLCLQTERHPGCMVVTVSRDSLVMTSGIATLLHPGDTVRVFRR